MKARPWYRELSDSIFVLGKSGCDRVGHAGIRHAVVADIPPGLLVLVVLLPRGRPVLGGGAAGSYSSVSGVLPQGGLRASVPEFPQLSTRAQYT